MPLKYSYTSEADIPADNKALYKQSGNDWILDIEGDPVSDYRNRNIRLQQERDNDILPLLNKYKDLGAVDDLKKLVEIKGDLDVSKLVRSNKVDEAVEKRLEGVKAEHAKETTKLTGERDGLQKQLEKMMIDNAAMAVAAKMGARDTALPDIVSRMRNVFKVEGGKLIAYKPNGEKDYGKSGDGLTMEEAMERAKGDGPHLFEENKGLQSDATKGSPATTKGHYTGTNPWKPDEKGKAGNLGERMRITKDDPALAKRLRREAGLPEVPAQA
jgi:hypothetical protein